MNHQDLTLLLVAVLFLFAVAYYASESRVLHDILAGVLWGLLLGGLASLTLDVLT